MKILREYIEFERTNDPYYNLGLGQKQMIERWLEDMDIPEENYRINDDLTIDILNNINLIHNEIKELPDFIQFNKIYGSFYAGGNPWQSLKGFPKEIFGDLQVYSYSHPDPLEKKFKESEIKKTIKVHGKIWH